MKRSVYKFTDVLGECTDPVFRVEM